jgi:hypothetical protein
MARTQNSTNSEAGANGDVSSCGASSSVDPAAAAREQVLEFARALARLAAQEDDAAERNETGPLARVQSTEKRALRSP